MGKMSSSTKVSRINIFSDGASRGNPGPSSIAFIILNVDGNVLEKCSEFIGTGTNNQAEYEALSRALEVALEFTSKDVVCHLDSELVVKQLNGEYEVHNHVLREMQLKVNRIKRRFRNVSFEHVPRTNVYIQQVDEMANKILDDVENRFKTGN